MIEAARPWVGRAARVLLGLAFLVPGLLKATDPADFVREMATYGIVGEGIARVAAPLLIAFEIALGVALVAGWFPRGAPVAAAILLVVFVAIEARAMAQGRTESCGCFGAYLKRTPAQVIVEDLALLAVAAAALWGSFRRPAPTRRATVAAAVTLAAALALTLASPSLPIDPLVTRLAVGRSAASLGLDDRLPDPDGGRTLVVLLDVAAPGAAELAADLTAGAARPGAPRLVALTPSTEEEIVAFLWAATPGFEVHRVDRDRLKPLYRRLPRSFILDEGRVVAVYNGPPPAAPEPFSSEAS